jgi:hypothetical protein
MPDYSRGKIYELVCRKTGERYVGSTTLALLCTRLAIHVWGYKNGMGTMSKQIIERGDYYINLLELCPCETKEQLLKKEREWYDKGPCVNKLCPWKSKEELTLHQRQKSREWYVNNKDKKDEYYIKNAEKLKQGRKVYYQANKEYFKQKNKEQRDNMTEEDLQAKKAAEKARRELHKQNKIVCQCGCSVVKYSLNEHLKSKKHLAFLKGLEMNINNLAV